MAQQVNPAVQMTVRPGEAEGRRVMQRWIGFTERVFTGAAVFCCLAMISLITADAAGRYLLNRPILGAFEITEQYLMVAIVFLGTCSAYSEGAFVRVTFAVKHMPQAIKVILSYFVQVFSILLSLAFVLATGRQTLKILARHEVLEVVDIALWPAYALVPLGLSLALIKMGFDFTRIKTGKSALFKDEDTST
jgi:TRAP-type C4-dicarboxylate transport system permease small subunit